MPSLQHMVYLSSENRKAGTRHLDDHVARMPGRVIDVELFGKLRSAPTGLSPLAVRSTGRELGISPSRVLSGLTRLETWGFLEHVDDDRWGSRVWHVLPVPPVPRRMRDNLRGTHTFKVVRDRLPEEMSKPELWALYRAFPDSRAAGLYRHLRQVNEPLTKAKLARDFFVTRPTVDNWLTKLTQRGLVEILYEQECMLLYSEECEEEVNDGVLSLYLNSTAAVPEPFDARKLTEDEKIGRGQWERLLNYYYDLKRARDGKKGNEVLSGDGSKGRDQKAAMTLCRENTFRSLQGALTYFICSWDGEQRAKYGETLTTFLYNLEAIRVEFSEWEKGEPKYVENKLRKYDLLDKYGGSIKKREVDPAESEFTRKMRAKAAQRWAPVEAVE